MSSVFETIMLVCFGCSWPINGIKAWKARTAKSTSLPFLCLILFGYICGIIAKIASPDGLNYVFAVYILNVLIVCGNLVIYFRNRALDRKAGI